MRLKLSENSKTSPMRLNKTFFLCPKIFADFYSWVKFRILNKNSLFGELGEEILLSQGFTWWLRDSSHERNLSLYGVGVQSRFFRWRVRGNRRGELFCEFFSINLDQWEEGISDLAILIGQKFRKKFHPYPCPSPFI